MSEVRPPCKCHGEPAVWQADKRCRAGGYWRCRVKRAAYWQTFYAANRPARLEHQRAYKTDPDVLRRANERQRDKYDNDPLYRLEKNMKNARWQRRRTLNRMRERLEGIRGEV